MQKDLRSLCNTWVISEQIFNSIILAVSGAVKPADQRKTPETLSKRLIKATEDDGNDRQGIESVEKVNSLLPQLHNSLSVQI